MMKRFKQARKIFGITMLTGTAVAFFYSAQYEVLKLAINYWNPISITEYRLKNLSTDEFIAEIQNSIAENKLSEAAEIVEIAQEYGHQIPQELVDETKVGIFSTVFVMTSNFGRGYLLGNMDTPEAMFGTIWSDFTLIGDVRDLTYQGYNFVKGDDYDPIVFGLAGFGLVTSKAALLAWGASTGSAGTSLPIALTATGIDNSVSVIKNARKIGKLSPKLTDNIYELTRNSVNKQSISEALEVMPSIVKMPPSSKIMNALSNIDVKKISSGNTEDLAKTVIEMNPVDMGALSKVSDKLVNPKAIDGLTTLAKGNYNIIKAGGIRTSFKALEIADDARDMSKISVLATKFSSKTASILKVLGKKAIQLGKLLYLIGVIIIGIIGWLLYAAWLAFSATKGTIRLINRAGKRA